MEKGFFESGCPRGNKCFFAHSEEELRTKPAEEYRYTLTLEMPNGVKCFANATAKDSAVEAKAELASQALRDHDHIPQHAFAAKIRGDNDGAMYSSKRKVIASCLAPSMYAACTQHMSTYMLGYSL